MQAQYSDEIRRLAVPQMFAAIFVFVVLMPRVWFRASASSSA